MQKHDSNKSMTRPGLAQDGRYIAPSFTDPATGAVWVHRDLEQRVKPWEVKDYVSPVAEVITFADVSSWAAYVAKYCDPKSALLTADLSGLSAVLDYHTPFEGAAAGTPRERRARWKAVCPFEATPAFRDWERLADGEPRGQLAVIEFLEEHMGDITEPDASLLLNVLRGLRTNVAIAARTEVRPDGGTFVQFERAQGVTNVASVEIPTRLVVRVQVFKQHSTSAGPVFCHLPVRIRVGTDGEAKLHVRFSAAPHLEAAVDKAFGEVVDAAGKALDGVVLKGKR